jgi:hypothetical protein
MDGLFPVLPLMWAVQGYRPHWGLPVDNPTWRPVWYQLDRDVTYFAPRAIAWLYRLLPLVAWWDPPGQDSSSFGWVAPGVAGYRWHVGYVRPWTRFDGASCGGHFVALLGGHNWSSGNDPQIPDRVTFDDAGFHGEP